MSALPSISLVTASFRAAATLEPTIRSVVEQRYPHLEYIVSDGGSDDCTRKILERNSGSLAKWWSEPDAGQYDAINKGFAASTGEIMGWLNADDMLLPRSLHLIGEVFAQLPEVEWISTLRPGFWDANGYFVGTDRIPGFSRAAFPDGLYLPGVQPRGHWIQQESTFWRRSLWERTGGALNTKYGLAADFELWSRFFASGQLHGLDYPLAGFRIIGGQRSENITAYLEEARQALDAARKRVQWTELGTNRFLYSTKARKISMVQHAIQTRLGYPALRISNRNMKEAGSGWAVSPYDFLP